MNLLEHEGKALLAAAGAPLPQSWLVRSADDVPADVVFPVVAKSQVPVGGRGKAGGILPVSSASDLNKALQTIFGLSIKGHAPAAVLLEEQLSIERELYLALRLNRDMRRVEWMVSDRGGVDIEDNAGDVLVMPMGERDAFEHISSALHVPFNAINVLCENLQKAFMANDLTLLEINPLVVVTSGGLVCADVKCSVDDNARFRHAGLPWPDQTRNAPQPLGGTIGCIANGAGMAMSTMDTIVAAGGRPANFLDIGGGTGEREFVTALGDVARLPGVTCIVINIFAGISRCDEIARGIIAARKQLPELPPLLIRLDGTNRDIAVELLTGAGIAIEPDLKTCVQKAMEVTA